MKGKAPLAVVLDFFGVLVQEGMSVSQTLYGMVREHVGYEPMWSTYMRLALGQAPDEEFWKLVAPAGSDWRKLREKFGR